MAHALPSLLRNAIYEREESVALALNPPESIGFPHVSDPPNAEYGEYIGFNQYDTDARRVSWEIERGSNLVRCDNFILDSLIRMPPGFRTKPGINGLSFMPLGLLTYRLRQRALAIDGNDSVLGALVVDGEVYRLKNRVSTIPAVNEEGVPYMRQKVFQEVERYSFNHFPLDRVIFDWPGETWNGVNHDWLTSGDYLGTMTRYPDHGSDMQAYIMTDKASIFKRYTNLRVTGYDQPDTRVYKTRLMRTAGLRQVIYKPLEFIIVHKNTVLGTEDEHQMYFPCGSDGNCFEACVKFVFDKLCPNPIHKFSKIFRNIFWELYPKETSIDGVLKQKRQGGFTSKDMKGFSLLFYKATGYRLECWSKRSNGKKSNWVNVCALEELDPSKNNRRITIFQCYDDGRVRDDSKKEIDEYFDNSEEQDRRNLGLMMHCIAMYPEPACFLPFDMSKKGSNYQFNRSRTELFEKINAYTISFMEAMTKRMKYWEDITEQDISELVEVQKGRKKEVNTGIFNVKRVKINNNQVGEDEAHNNNGGSMKTWQAREYELNALTPQIYVFAYDLETVDNSALLSSRVWTPFRHLDNPDPNLYDPPESQIPYMAQWICINLSDSGPFLNLKLEESSKHPDRPTTLTTYTPDEDSPNPDYFVSSPRIETGGESLGKCVEDMLVNIAQYVHTRGGKQAYLYAHNGSKFDVYIVLQFCRFRITSKFLKTSRGIITCTIRVPICSYEEMMECNGDPDEEIPHISITFRDTLLIFNASLSRLCKCFGVPIQLSKIDFPIARVKSSNCYHPSLFPIIKEYGRNDVLALGYIMVEMNKVIGSDVQWKPASIYSLKSPLLQFTTLMGMIKKSTFIHFHTKMGVPRDMLPSAIDLPALRHWLQKATIGGRVNAYAKTYVSPFAGDIMHAFIAKNTSALQLLHKQMVESDKCMQVLDFTSLYPFAMDSCPMPTGSLHFLSKHESELSIQAIHCDACDSARQLCTIHRLVFNDASKVLRPFAIIIVRGVTLLPYAKDGLRNMCGRKSFLKTTQKDIGLQYTLETNAEFSFRHTKEEFHETQSFTNVDLYWMRRCGYTFEVIGGFGFGVSNIYNTFIGPAFLQRIEAKKAKNTVLSEFLKLKYNGSYGVTAQRDITENHFCVSLPPELKYVNPFEPEVMKYIRSYRRRNAKGSELLATEELTGEVQYLPGDQAVFQKRQKEHLAEFYESLSPMQIGAAVLAWSRHVANLVMVNTDDKHQIYTDTDSIAISNEHTHFPSPLAEMIQNCDDAPLGSLKNDHGDDGPDARIFFGMIGTKKVKGYFTLTSNGEVHIHNTFKGLHIAKEDIAGFSRDPDYIEKICCETLLSLNMHSKSEPVEVTAWTRRLGEGVTIRRVLQQLNPETYLENCRGTRVEEQSYGTVEYFVPHGSAVDVHYPVYYNPQDGSLNQSELRSLDLEDGIYHHILGGSDTIKKFISSYYTKSEDYYNPNTDEWRNIQDAFAKASDELL